jgi:AraC-like DNA-binding protein
LTKVTSICFLSGPYKQIDKKCTVEISSLVIRPDLWPLQQAFLIGALFYYLLLFLLPIYKHRKERVHYVPIYPQQNSMPEGPVEKIQHVMASQFHMADLTVEMVAAASGVPAYKIPVLLQEHMGLNFKKLLNMIRLEEAKRLLQNPQLRISEVAYQVGYQHVQHFNRIFKEATSQTPKEFREHFLLDASGVLSHKH